MSSETNMLLSFENLTGKIIPKIKAISESGLKFLIILLFLVKLTLPVHGQTNDTIPGNLKEVVITGYKNEPIQLSPLNIKSIMMDSANTANSFNLCDILKRTEGVTALSTGIGIAKPVIRGLYGNRVLILLNGLKFDNQQWQEEHGLGLTSFGLSKIELIKGPIGILYGTEAIGGVINLIEEEKPKPNSHQADLSISLNSNTLGGMIQAGYKAQKNNKWWRIRIGMDNHGDYSDGKNQRVLNSRFDGYYFKSTYGFQRKKWKSDNNYSSSFNRFGFIFNDVYTFISPDKRWSRKLNESPAHLVLLNILSSENYFQISPNLKVTANIGIQSNERMENEGGGAISLNMHLLTVQNLLKLECQLSEKHKAIISNLNSFEDNTNFGARKIVPDANLYENNISINHEFKPRPELIFENGFGIGQKNIKTYFTATVNGPDKEVQPFKKSSNYYNLFSGLSYNPTNEFNLKFNLASGVRVANLAELSSNGLHEGVFTYEIGNPNLKNEQIYSSNLFINYDSGKFGISASPFYNYFTNYIYLTPVNEIWYGFPVYRYKQQNALQFGAEFSIYYYLQENTELKITYSGMSSKTRDGNYTPHIPTQKITPRLSYQTGLDNKYKINLYTDLENNLAQNNIAPYELPTPFYCTWNAGISLQPIHTKWSMGLFVNNILNRAYTDHLSRFKNFGLLNIGRNFIVNIKYIL